MARVIISDQVLEDLFLSGFEINVKMAHLVKIVDPRLMDVIKERHGENPIRICPFFMRHIETNDSTTEAMIRDALRVRDASDPPAAALHALEEACLSEKIKG